MRRILRGCYSHPCTARVGLSQVDTASWAGAVPRRPTRLLDEPGAPGRVSGLRTTATLRPVWSTERLPAQVL